MGYHSEVETRAARWYSKSSKVEVIENTVDTTKAGEYKVVYKVTDSQGASVTKEIKVTVEEVITDSDNNTPGNGSNNTPNDNIANGDNSINNNTNLGANLPQTGGTSVVVVLIIALIAIASRIFIFRKKKNKILEI